MIYTITTAFCNHKIFEKSIRQYYKLQELNAKHYVMDNGYPINKKKNSAAIKKLCEEFGIEYVNVGKNLGLHKGFNHILDLIKIKDDDIIIGYDGDSFPISKGFDNCLASIIQQSKGHVSWSSLMSDRQKEDIHSKPYTEGKIGQIDVTFPHQAVMNSVCGFHGKFLNHTKGLHEPLEFYGLLECAMYEMLKEFNPNKNSWAFAKDWWEDGTLSGLHDWSYTMYKWCYAHLKNTQLDFESWLDAGQPGNPEPNPPKNSK